MAGEIQVVQANDKQDSIELNRTSTGKVSFSVKLYYDSDKTSPAEQSVKLEAYLAAVGVVAKKYEV